MTVNVQEGETVVGINRILDAKVLYCFSTALALLVKKYLLYQRARLSSTNRQA